jgi:hypothetical protein
MPMGFRQPVWAAGNLPRLSPWPPAVVLFVVWFTEDAGFKWQLDEYLHLAQVPDDDDQSEYRPL